MSRVRAHQIVTRVAGIDEKLALAYPEIAVQLELHDKSTNRTRVSSDAYARHARMSSGSRLG